MLNFLKKSLDLFSIIMNKEPKNIQVSKSGDKKDLEKTNKQKPQTKLNNNNLFK